MFCNLENGNKKYKNKPCSFLLYWTFIPNNRFSPPKKFPESTKVNS